MDKLNNTILQSLEPNTHLEIVNVDVKRLRDDHSEIQLGQEVAFVATFALRITQTGINVLKHMADSAKSAGGQSGSTDCWHALAAEDKLLVIDTDAEVRSDKVPIDEDSVIWWIDQHYDFTFLLNGREDTAFHELGQVQVSTGNGSNEDHTLSLPWLKKLAIGDLKEDYIDVDVRIDRIEQKSEDTASQKPPAPVGVITNDVVSSRTQARGFILDATIESKRSLDELRDKEIRFVADDNSDVKITLVLRVRDPRGQKRSLDTSGSRLSPGSRTPRTTSLA